MRPVRFLLLLLSVTACLFAQSDRGTITGTVADPVGAVVAAAPIEARNVETGAQYQAATSATGNYTLSQLPTGTYEISISVAGFKKYVRQNIVVGVAQTLRVDAQLEVGSATDSVTVTEAAPLLKTESGELSHNVAAQTMNALPILGIGASAGSAGIRNPAAVTLLLPGSQYSGNATVRINGGQANTNQYRIEGMDASNGYLSGLNQQTQPSVDAIQEIAVQTSNFAAEYGQVGSGLFNLTMRSGSNQYHGSAYDYFVNEGLNAGQAFTNNGKGGLIRQRQRRNDYGFTFGGPVWIPKLYDGHDRTFFFLNFEQYRESQTVSNEFITVPTDAYRQGNFQQAMTGRNLCLVTATSPAGCDPLGRAILEGTIYDPSTQRIAANGQVIRDPFPNNTIPQSQMDPVALKIQALIPNATLPNALVNNGLYPFPSNRVTTIPAVKIDHSISSKAKISIYSSQTKTVAPFSQGNANGDGLPDVITQGRGTGIYSYTHRVNFDYTWTPTVLMHLGAGYTDNDFYSSAAVTDFDAAKELGLRGIPIVRQFPTFTGLGGTAPLAARGGMKNMGPGNVSNPYVSKPTAIASVTWVKGNHTIKVGGEMRLEGYIGRLYSGATGEFGFSAEQTTLPSAQSQNLAGGTIGFSYASFLLGRAATMNLTEPPIFRLGKHQFGSYAQDTWKITRRITLDYGMRYDYSTYLREQYGRMLNFSPVTPNPSAGGILGATIFEGYGENRCNCEFAQNYKLALAPRLGLAYQINQKTVLRAGFGIVYGNTADANGAANTLPVNEAKGAPAFGEAVMLLRDGLSIPFSQYRWPNFNVGQYPQGNSLNSPPIAIDQNAGRPPRQVQWSVGLQRQLSSNLVLEASYVANRGVWWNSPILIDVNGLTAQRLGAFGIDLNNAADRTLLTSRLDSAASVARGFNQRVPYAGYPLSANVNQSLRPFPQFGNINRWWSPLGKTWYDSLQVKATKRFSYGLSFTSVFTWQKNMVSGSANLPTVGTTVAFTPPPNDAYNRQIQKALSPFDQPFVFNSAINYTIPRLKVNKYLSLLVGDWTVGAFVAYASGTPLLVPAAQNRLNTLLFRGTVANRVAGEPLFTQDLNCHCFDPNKQFVLNPKAWADPAAGQWGTSAPYLADYRTNRRPQESLNIGRDFRIREGMKLNLRAEFTNIFNRVILNSPTSTNALATQTFDATGKANAGFGWINTATLASPPRQGVIVGRFTF